MYCVLVYLVIISDLFIKVICHVELISPSPLPKNIIIIILSFCIVAFLY